MGGLNRTGTNTAHDLALLQAEQARQASLAANPSASQAQVDAIEITFYRAVLASARATGCGAEAALRTLRDLGVNA